MIYANSPRKHLHGNGEVVVHRLVRDVRINWVRVRIRIARVNRWSRVSETCDFVNTELVNVVSYDCKLHWTHNVVLTIVAVTVPAAAAPVGSVAGSAIVAAAWL